MANVPLNTTLVFIVFHSPLSSFECGAQNSELIKELCHQSRDIISISPCYTDVQLTPRTLRRPTQKMLRGP